MFLKIKQYKSKENYYLNSLFELKLSEKERKKL